MSDRRLCPSLILKSKQLNFTTWQVSRKNKDLGLALRAPGPYFLVVNWRTLPSRMNLITLPGRERE
jgi:hypothetical protein